MGSGVGVITGECKLAIPTDGPAGILNVASRQEEDAESGKGLDLPQPAAINPLVFQLDTKICSKHVFPIYHHANPGRLSGRGPSRRSKIASEFSLRQETERVRTFGGQVHVVISRGHEEACGAGGAFVGNSPQSVPGGQVRGTGDVISCCILAQQHIRNVRPQFEKVCSAWFQLDLPMAIGCQAWDSNRAVILPAEVIALHGLYGYDPWADSQDRPYGIGAVGPNLEGRSGASGGPRLTEKEIATARERDLGGQQGSRGGPGQG